MKKKTRKEKIEEQQMEMNKKKQANKKVKFLIKLLIAIGALFNVLEIMIFRKTFIPWYIPVLLSFTTGIISTIIISIFLKKFSMFLFQDAPKLIIILFNSLLFGGLIIYILMLVNFKSPEVNIETHKLIIKSKSFMEGGSSYLPLVNIEYKGLEKTIIFNSNQKIKVDNAKHVLLKTKKGNLGYDLIIEKELIE